MESTRASVAVEWSYASKHESFPESLDLTISGWCVIDDDDDDDDDDEEDEQAEKSGSKEYGFCQMHR